MASTPGGWGRSFGSAPSDVTVLCVPRANLGRHADSIGPRTALPLSAQGGIGRLLRYALSVVDEDVPGEGLARTYLADALTALLLAVFADATPETASVASDHRPYPRPCTGPPRRSPAQR